MEVSTVSPPPTSPTEGDDLCEIDVTNVAMHSVTLLICLFGVAGNGAVLRLLRLQTHNCRIFNLVIADFLFLLFALPSSVLFLLEDVSCSPIMPLMYVSFLFQLSLVSYYWGMYQVARVGFVTDMQKLCQFCCHCDPPWHRLSVVESVLYWAFFVLFTVTPTVKFLCPSHQQEHCRAALTSMFSIFLLLFAAPVVITRTINFIKAKWGSQQQQPKRHDIVIFLVVLLTLLLSLWNLLQQLGYVVVPSQVIFLLTCIYSSIKPFIYFLAGRCRSPCSVRSLRESLQRVFEEPEEKPPSSNDAAMDTVI